MKRLRLKTKLLTAGLLTMAVPVLVIGVIAGYKSMLGMEKLARDRMGDISRILASGLNSTLHEQIVTIRNLSYSGGVIAAAEKVAGKGDENARKEILFAQGVLTKIKDAEKGRLSSITLVGKDGIVFASSDNGKLKGLDLSGTDYVAQALRGSPNVDSVAISRETDSVICMAACPIYGSSGEEITGAVVLGMELRFLTSIAEQIDSGGSGDAYLVDRSGLYIAHPARGNILKGNITTIKGMAGMLAESRRGNNGLVQCEIDGVRKFAAFAPVPINGWTVVNTISEEELYASAHFTRNVILGTGIVFLILATVFFFFFARNLTRPLINLADASKKIASGDLEIEVGEKDRQDEIGTLSRAFHDMARSLAAARRRSDESDWLKTGVARMDEVVRGDPDLSTLASKVIAEMARYLDAQIGMFYMLEDGESPTLSLMGSYACKTNGNLPGVFKLGEGLVGQAALEKRRITVGDVPENYVRVTSGMVEGIPRFVCISPLLYQGRLKGVVEIGTLGKMTELQLEYLEQAMPAVAVAAESAENKARLQDSQREALLRVNYLQGLDSPVMAIDDQFNVMFINASGLELLGLTDTDVAGRKCYDLWSTGDCRTDRCACCRAMKEGRKIVDRTTASPAGKKMPIQYGGSPLKDANGRIIGAVELIIDVTELTEALEESRRLTEELQVQQEELETANEELEEQTKRLQESEEKLKAQQEELRVTNEELEEKNELLERQKQEVESARRQIEEKAEEVALASRYKSEFLANMSHELRTPLNSLLLLAQGLVRNKEGNLTGEQVKSAEIIHQSGSDLLGLINEVLDLSKIESGRMDLHMDLVPVAELAGGVRAAFEHVARDKGLTLEVDVRPDVPHRLTTDLRRTEQVLRNMVSNAIKFTETGTVTVIFERPAPDADLSRSGLDPAKSLKVTVQDTGIGIAPKDQKRIFEAFQQADGGTARKYGGTGLGLSISRELAQLLGGEIQVQSEPGQGSAFTLYLPIGGGERQKGPALKEDERKAWNLEAPEETKGCESKTEDDRDNISRGDRVILVIEDDPKFAKVLLDTCRERRFKCLAAADGEAGLALAARYAPDGIILDIRMPGMDGWAVLDALKNDIRTRHIPVHVISIEETPTESLRKGAVGHATKPITREELDRAFERIEKIAAEKKKRVLLVEDDEKMRRSVKNLIGNGDVEVDEAASGEQAVEALRTTQYGCLVLDLGLPDMKGIELLARMERENIDLPPVIIHTSRDLTEQEEMDLREHAQSIVIKDVRSQERLLDEVSLFLHRMVGKMPETKKQMIRKLHETDALLKDKKVLIVDDDMRTTFAVSRLLAERGMNTLKAGNGEQALKTLEEEPDIDMVLMDIMMPVMDGYEAMRRIRGEERFRRLPIIALTAKAMPEDRLKCIEAGANDYLPKPVDPERLISIMRVWLYR